MASCSPPPKRHNSSLAPTTLPEELLPGHFCAGLQRPDAAPAGTPLIDEPFYVLEQSTHFFLLQIRDKTDKVSMLRLKPAQTNADTEPAQPPCRRRPAAQAPPSRVPPPPRCRLEPPQGVTFQLPLVKPPTCKYCTYIPTLPNYSVTSLIYVLYIVHGSLHDPTAISLNTSLPKHCILRHNVD
jgi:hypothetical protein